MKFLDIDGPFMSLLTAIADMIILNLLTLFCCLPVITAGAAFTALHYVVLKQVRGDSPYVIRSFFKSFKQNFLQATGIWLFCLIIIGIDAMDIAIIIRNPGAVPVPVQGAVIAASILVLAVAVYVFPLLARFENTMAGTVRNALVMAAANLPRTILMLAIYLFLPALVNMNTSLIPVFILFGFSVPAYMAARVYSPVFRRYEPEEEEVPGSAWELPDTDGEKEEKTEKSRGRDI